MNAETNHATQLAEVELLFHKVVITSGKTNNKELVNHVFSSAHAVIYLSIIWPCRYFAKLIILTLWMI